MSSYPAHEHAFPFPETDLSNPISSLDAVNVNSEIQTLMVTNFDLPEGDPNRYTSIVVTPGQLKELGDEEGSQIGQYHHWENGKLQYSVPLSVADAQPLLLAATSPLRGSGASERQATARAFNQLAPRIGFAAVAGDGIYLHLQ